jgi:phosphohistidine phosphatase SixA
VTDCPMLACIPLIALALGLPPAQPASAPMLSGRALVTALRQGGYVLVMRHASSPRERPDAQAADPSNPQRERQLDASGRASAQMFGNVLRALKIPIGEVLTSPTYRAMETARLAGLPHPRQQPELGDGGQSMQASGGDQIDWLRTKVTKRPRATNTILITHQPNIAGAFPESSAGLSDGEALVFAPDGAGHATLVARIKIDQWPELQREESRQRESSRLRHSRTAP